MPKGESRRSFQRGRRSMWICLGGVSRVQKSVGEANSREAGYARGYASLA